MRSKHHRRFVGLLLVAALALILIHSVMTVVVFGFDTYPMIDLGSRDIDPVYWFDLNNEKRFGAIFGASIIVIAAVCMLWTGLKTETRKWMLAGYILVSGIIFFMACDEFFSIHERTGQMAGVSAEYGSQVVPGWVKVMAVVVALLCIPMGAFWWHLPKAFKIRTMIAAAVFLGGAMGVEVISSAFVMHQGTKETLGYGLLVAIEEGMEMIGIVILIDAILLHRAKALASVEASDAPPQASPAPAMG
jgi:hypothetical protein